MADKSKPVSPDAPLTVPDESSGARQVLHWFDFLRPFCYVRRHAVVET